MQAVFNLACLILLSLGLPSTPAQDVTAAQFAAKALPLLPVEERYAFAHRLSEWQEPPRRNSAARLLVGEMGLAAEGWKLLGPPETGPVLQQAAEDCREYLEHGMQVSVSIETPASLADWRVARRAIVAGTRDSMPAGQDWELICIKLRHSV